MAMYSFSQYDKCIVVNVDYSGYYRNKNLYHYIHDLLATLIVRYYKKKKDKDIHIKLIASKTVE